jgi:hypothetical protein
MFLTLLECDLFAQKVNKAQIFYGSKLSFMFITITLQANENCVLLTVKASKRTTYSPDSCRRPLTGDPN